MTDERLAWIVSDFQEREPGFYAREGNAKMVAMQDLIREVTRLRSPAASPPADSAALVEKLLFTAERVVEARGGDAFKAALAEHDDARAKLDAFVAALHARVERAEADVARMNWLERQHIEVRKPLRYGSAAMFCVSPDTDDGYDDPSDLRARIDAALSAPPSPDTTHAPTHNED